MQIEKEKEAEKSRDTDKDDAVKSEDVVKSKGMNKVERGFAKLTRVMSGSGQAKK